MTTEISLKKQLTIRITAPATNNATFKNYILSNENHVPLWNSTSWLNMKYRNKNQKTLKDGQICNIKNQ